MRWLDGITESMDMNFGKLQEMVRHREAWCAVVYGVVKCWTRDLVTEQQIAQYQKTNNPTTK